MLKIKAALLLCVYREK